MNKDTIKKIYDINNRKDMTKKQKQTEISKIFQSLNKTNKTTKIKNPRCVHYERKCVMECPKCLCFFKCRICHDEYENHVLDRFNVEKIKCLECGTIQQSSNKCTKCSIHFSDYYCGICNLWRAKSTFHCDLCGICRNGEKKNYKHCETCGLCLHVKCEHKCVKDSSHSNCPICEEYLFSSCSEVQVLKTCGHSIHHKCLKEYGKNNYFCPICKKTIKEFNINWVQLKTIINIYKMPEEYNKWKIKIYCNDCEKKNIVSKHFMGNECPNCGSFNTNILEDYKNGNLL